MAEMSTMDNTVTAQTTAIGGPDDPLIHGLTALPELLIKQSRRGWLAECLCGCCLEVKNRYRIFNAADPNIKSDNPMLMAHESSGGFCRMCCGSLREFEMSIEVPQPGNPKLKHKKDPSVQQMLRLERPFRLRQKMCLFPTPCLSFMQNVIRVYSGENTLQPNALLGYAREDYFFCFPQISVFDGGDNKMYTIEGSCSLCLACQYKLEIKDTAGEVVGFIQKRWGGLGRELFTDADNFFLSFPPTANAVQRAILLGAVYLVDFLYYEEKGGGGQDGGW